MTDKDIEKLLICRKAIDAHRNFKWSGGVKNTDTNAVWESYAKCLNFLNENGFGSIDAFDKFNNAMCLEAYKDCRPIRGACDGCVGLPTPKCILIWGKICSRANDATKDADDIIYKLALKFRNEGTKISGKVNVVSIGCPDGHGFYGDEADYKEFPFDVSWRI